MKRVKALSLVLAGSFLAGTLSACVPAQQQQPGGTVPSAAAQQAAPAEGGATGSLIIATENETPSLAPGRHASLQAGFKNAMTHNGLFRTDFQTLNPVPDLVESYRAINDSLIEFTLRQGILFHNGEELTADDVVASLEYVRSYPDASAFHQSLVSAEVVDRYVLTIYTGEPNATLFADLAIHGNFIMPKSLIDSGHDFTAVPIGSGPYIFEEWRSGDFLQFTAFDYYFDTERAPLIRDVTWRIIPEGASRTIALEVGEADFILEVAAPDIPRMQDNPNIEVVTGMSTLHSHLLLNHDNPMFANIAVRRALDMAIDKDAVVIAGLDGFGVPIYNQSPVVFPGVSSEGENSFDPEGARAVLAEAGVDPSTITFDIIASNDSRRRMAEVMQANLADIGVSAQIVSMDLATFMAVTTDGNYETAIASWTTASLLTYMVAMLHADSIGGGNRNRVNHPELSALIDRTVATVDAGERLALIGEVTRVANEYTVMVPLFQGMVIRAFNSNLAVPEVCGAGALNINMMYWR